MSEPDEAQFLRDIGRNRVNAALLERWSDLALPDGWLVAGCLFQTVWNLRTGRPPEADIQDYDLFYFDGADLSPDAEATVQARADAVTRDLGAVVEVKNQARVHLWYPSYFGHAYPQLRDSQDGIDRFLIPATCVGIRPSGRDHDVYAPHGLPILYEGLLTPNPLTDHRELFLAKAASYQARWPWLRIGSLIR